VTVAEPVIAVDKRTRKFVNPSTDVDQARLVEATNVYTDSVVNESTLAALIGIQLVLSGETSNVNAPAVTVDVATTAIETVLKPVTATELAVFRPVEDVQAVDETEDCEP
jgi:hypothetical protein